MIPSAPTISVPLRTDEHGKIRVGKSRVLLELVIHAYRQGETPEGIIDMYSTLVLSDVYAVIAYYLEHTAEIDAYVHREAELDKQFMQEIDANRTPEARALRERLRAYRDQHFSQSSDQPPRLLDEFRTPAQFLTHPIGISIAIISDKDQFAPDAQGFSDIAKGMMGDGYTS
jgi:uncharacterized protein (DUF433 family)